MELSRSYIIIIVSSSKSTCHYPIGSIPISFPHQQSTLHFKPPPKLKLSLSSSNHLFFSLSLPSLSSLNSNGNISILRPQDPFFFLYRNHAMEALNASSLTPVSVLSDRRTEKPRKVTSLSLSLSLSPPKFPKSSKIETTPLKNFQKNLNGGLVILFSVLSNGFARALTYEEALEQSNGGGSSSSDFDVGLDISGVLDGVVSFGTENPLVIVGGAALVAIPLVLSKVLQKPKAFGIESAKNAYAKIGEDGSAQLLDIRPPVELREVGSPDVRGLKKKAVSIVYKGDDKPGFLKKLALKFKNPENTTLFILDKFDGSSELVAELVTVNGFKAAYAIKDGAEGPRGWMSSGLPWIAPKKSFSFDFGNLADTFSAVGEGSEALAVSLGLAAAAGFGLLAFTEVETVLQLLGSAAIVQFVSKKLLFAEDRKATLKQLDEFVSNKIAPKELVGDVQQIGKALLPVSLDKKALPVPPVPDTSALKAEAVPESTTAAEPEAVPELVPQTNSVPKTEVKTDSDPKETKSLSPYPSYSDYKPPASPSPSQP